MSLGERSTSQRSIAFAENLGRSAVTIVWRGVSLTACLSKSDEETERLEQLESLMNCHADSENYQQQHRQVFPSIF